MQRTKIRSPIDGYVARRNAQVGQAVSVGGTLMAVVSNEQMWLEANFKETQLTNMRIGQPVKIHFDLYGKNKEFDGVINGIEMGTGNAFSLLPSQNATGNWIKVVQRVPVRIELNREDVDRHPLRIGLSMTVKVDISAAGAPISKTPDTVLPETEGTDWSEADRLVDEILEQYAH